MWAELRKPIRMAKHPGFGYFKGSLVTLKEQGKEADTGAQREL